MNSADAGILKCPGCGAPATAESARCDYCRARLATVSCGSCFGLLFEGAAFCHHCGAERSRVEAPEREAVRCPACRGTMHWIVVGGTDLLECEACDGTWVEAAMFERVCANGEAQAAIVHGKPVIGAAAPAAPDNVRPASAPSHAAPIRYRPCPRCGKLMNRINFGRLSGAIVDVCKGHGTFLDRGELHQVIRFIQAGGMDRSREAQREELLEQQRRLRDLERDHARMYPEPTTSDWNEGMLSSLLSGLFEK